MSTLLLQTYLTSETEIFNITVQTELRKYQIIRQLPRYKTEGKTTSFFENFL